MNLSPAISVKPKILMMMMMLTMVTYPLADQPSPLTNILTNTTSYLTLLLPVTKPSQHAGPSVQEPAPQHSSSPLSQHFPGYPPTAGGGMA